MDIFQASQTLKERLIDNEYLDGDAISSAIFELNSTTIEFINVATIKKLDKKTAQAFCPDGFEVENVSYFEKYGKEYCVIMISVTESPEYKVNFNKTNYEKYFGTINKTAETLEKILLNKLSICNNMCAFGTDPKVDCANDIAADDFSCLFAIKQFLIKKDDKND